MKKSYFIILTLLLIIPFSVHAADPKPKVLTLTASSNDTRISYEGTTEDGSHAVMCKLYNSRDRELGLLSTEVDNNEFEGEFNVISGGTYRVSCANYEGGEIKSTTVDVDAPMVYELTFDVNGGTLKDIDLPTEVPEGTIFELEAISEDEIMPPEGKVFDAYEVNGKRYEVGEKYTVEDDVTVKILWKDINAETASETASNPTTSDAGIRNEMIILLVCAVGIAGSVIYLKKKKKTKKN